MLTAACCSATLIALNVLHPETYFISSVFVLTHLWDFFLGLYSPGDKAGGF